jgi:REP-associated tyrosine transposase
MRNPLTRYYGRGDLHFLTFSCYQRKPLLRTPRTRDVFVRILGEVREQYEFLLVGYVVMPEHVHMLVSESRMSTPSTVIQVLKQRVSRSLRQRGRATARNKGLRRSAGAELVLPSFWERRFYDFNVWSHDKRKEKLDYMHFNPVKRGLVALPGQWPWSSWSFYEGGDGGLVKIDPVD